MVDSGPVLVVLKSARGQVYLHKLTEDTPEYDVLCAKQVRFPAGRLMAKVMNNVCISQYTGIYI